MVNCLGQVLDLEFRFMQTGQGDGVRGSGGDGGYEPEPNGG